MLNRKDNMAFIIAHYHEEGKLPKHLLKHVKYIKKFSDQIIFVSTKLSPIYIKQLKPHATVIVRPNRGYDFYSYKIGLNVIQNIEDIDHLIFFNSSFLTIDPFKLYKQYLSRIAEDGLYGISSCSAPQYHIQSYFFSIAGKELIQSKVFFDWWERLKAINNRSAVIQKYEVGMTQWFLRNKIFVKSVYKPNIIWSFIMVYRFIRFTILMPQPFLEKLKRYFQHKKISAFSLTKTLNLTHFLYDDLCKAFSIVKIDLLTKNPTKQNLKHFIRYLSQKNNKITDIKFKKRK